MGSGSFVVSIIVLFGGTFLALAFLKDSSQRQEAAHIVPLPRIGGGALRRGPWPGCLGTAAEECVELIESYCPDCKVVVVQPDEVLSTKFDTQRVLIFVDEYGSVTKIPMRGR